MPSPHSGSSHSSSSHSSSHSSFGSGHSSFSGPSRHSSSSHSSSFQFGSGSSASGFGGSSGRSPSRRSQSSRASSAAFRSHYVASGSMRGSIIDRPRNNQPTGWIAWEHGQRMPVSHYCLKHNYEYYPSDWTDASTGRTYKKGYYDEEGQYYEDVAFRYDGRYKDVICRCEYCDTVTKLDWSEGGALICPQCGGTLKLVSFLDEYTRDPGYDKARRDPDYMEYGTGSRVAAQVGSLPKGVIAIFAFVAFFLVGIFAALMNRQDYADPGIGQRMIVVDTGWDVQPDETPEAEPQSNVELFGLTIYLAETEPGVYRVSSREDYSRKLSWSYSDQSYYDTDSGMWLWYNTDVLPNLWQYWYEPISGDFGDCGWMEYEPSGWFIEVSEGEWIPVPEEYDTSGLWHMEIDASDFTQNDPDEDLNGE